MDRVVIPVRGIKRAKDTSALLSGTLSVDWRRGFSYQIGTMTKLPFAVLFAALAASSSAFSATFKLPDDKPVVSITIPDSWKPEEIEKGVQGQTADSDVYLSIEITKSEKGMNAIIDGSFSMLKEHKIDLKKGGRKENKFDLNGLPADELLFQGKDEDGPTVVSITFVPVKDTVLVFTYWASPEGDKKHTKELSAIVQSVKAIK